MSERYARRDARKCNMLRSCKRWRDARMRGQEKKKRKRGLQSNKKCLNADIVIAIYRFFEVSTDCLRFGVNLVVGSNDLARSVVLYEALVGRRVISGAEGLHLHMNTIECLAIADHGHCGTKATASAGAECQRRGGLARSEHLGTLSGVVGQASDSSAGHNLKWGQHVC